MGQFFTRGTLTVIAAALALHAPGAARAANLYKIQPIFTIGEKIGSVQTNADGDIEMNSLNDAGQLSIVTETVPKGETLLQYAGGQVTPIVAPKGDAPGGGQWPDSVGFRGATMNQRGSILFAADVTDSDGKTTLGTFFWDYQAQKLTAVARTGMPAVNNLTFASGGGDMLPAIDNRDEIAFTASVNNAAVQARPGVFFRGSDGKLQGVALPDQALPAGGKIDFAYSMSLNDAGVVASRVVRQGDKGSSAYTWANGMITAVATVGMNLPGGDKLGDVWRVWVNNKNSNVLIAARTTDATSPTRLYLIAGGTVKAVAIPGQDMPGGGKLKRLQADIPDLISVGDRQIGLEFGVSAANDAGQHAFLAVLDDNSTGAYMMDADGTLSLLFKSGATTDLGTVASIGESGSVGGDGVDSIGIGLNNKGQLGLVLNIPNRRPTLVLLTPAGP